MLRASPDAMCDVSDTCRRGMYIARQLSFASAEYQTDIVDLSASQRGMYDGAALFWKEMLSCFHYARQAHPPTLSSPRVLEPRARAAATRLQPACACMCSRR